MKKINLITICSILLLFSCKKYDEIALWNMANDHEQRLTTLEELCSQMNTNISALQAIVSASQNGDYISNIAPIIKNGIEIGYTITFVKNGTITIYHGKDGQKGEQGDSGEGAMPLIGIRQDIDGVHYWTLNNEWLLDGSGKKVKASGTNGLDGENGTNGKTPKFKIEGGRWLLSMDNGVTWEDIGQATGDNGQDGTGGDSMFKNIDYTTSNDFVIFTLTDGTEIKLSKYGNSSSTGELSIIFSETTNIKVMPLVDYNITYTIIGANINTTIEVLGIDGFIAIVKPASLTSGTIIITPPTTRPVNKKIVVFISNGENVTIMKTLTFQYENDSPYITFPDINFKTYLVANFDKDNNGEISYSEAEQVKEIQCHGKDIQSLEGIQYFFNITALNCGENKLTKLDISKLYKLESLSCGSNDEYHNRLTTLDVSKNIALKILNCMRNQLISLDVSNNTALTNLSCGVNNITTLNISSNTALVTLDCVQNSLTSLDLTKNVKLTDANCGYNKLTSLNISSNSSLKYLRCDGNLLDETAINNIYTNLPQGQKWNDGSFDRQSTIITSNNLSTGDKTIATKKNWLVN